MRPFKTMAVAMACLFYSLGAAIPFTAQALTLKGGIQASTFEPEPANGIAGLDIKISPKQYPIVEAVFPQTPAEQAGLKAGDVLLQIDGHSTYKQSAAAVDIAISNIPGTPVHFHVLRKGQELLTVQLVIAPASPIPRKTAYGH
jgi:C-terminal processing protease CtpA/Prc